MAKKNDTTARAVAAYFSASALLDPFRLKWWDEAQLTVTQLRLLTLLEAEEGVGNAELADKLLVTRPSVSALLDRLERGGFLRREISPDDRRGIRIWLEQPGRDAVTQVKGEATDWASHLFQGLTKKEQLDFAVAVEKVVASARDLRSKELAAPPVAK